LAGRERLRAILYYTVLRGSVGLPGLKAAKKMKRIRPASLLGFMILGLGQGAGRPTQAQVSFVSAGNFPTGFTPVAAAIAELNGDGKPHLIMDKTGLVSGIRDLHGRSDLKGFVDFPGKGTGRHDW
jgi:hypothetical protein